MNPIQNMSDINTDMFDIEQIVMYRSLISEKTVNST